MLASLFKKARKRRAFAAALAEIQRQTFTGLMHDPNQVNCVLQGTPPPRHWSAAVRRLFPQDPGLLDQLDALEILIARRIASALLQSVDKRQQLNDSIQRARDAQKTAATTREQAADGLLLTRSAVLQRAGDIAEKRNRQRVLQRRLLAVYGRAGACYLLAAVTLVGETMSLASAFFAMFRNPDLTQKVAVWSGCLAASLALGFFSERGIRPIFDQKGNAQCSFSWRSPMGIALLLTVVLSSVVAWVRTISTGEGGSSDIAQFLFGILTLPILALLAGGWAALGTHQLEPLARLRHDIDTLEEERSALNACLDQMDIQEHDHGGSQQRAAAELESASVAEKEALAAKEALLQSVYQAVVSSPEIRELVADVAAEAAEIACASRGCSVSLTSLTPIILAATLLPTLAGCGEMRSAFGGHSPRRGVSVLLDPTMSVRGSAAFREQTLEELRRFLETASEGSHFEVWAISARPGMPSLVYQFTMPQTLPRERKGLAARAERELRTALEGRPDPRTLPWSSVLEDSYRAAERLGGLPVDERRLVVMSDLQQYSPTLSLSRILREPDSEPLVEELLRSYPPLGYQPTEVSLVTLPGSNNATQAPTPAEDARLKAFWSRLWCAWNAPKPRFSEPTSLAPLE